MDNKSNCGGNLQLVWLLISEAIRSAMEQLELLGAVVRKEERVSLTPLGKKMASFPLEPRFSKVITVYTFLYRKSTPTYTYRS